MGRPGNSGSVSPSLRPAWVGDCSISVAGGQAMRNKRARGQSSPNYPVRNQWFLGPERNVPRIVGIKIRLLHTLATGYIGELLSPLDRRCQDSATKRKLESGIVRAVRRSERLGLRVLPSSARAIS